MHLIKNTHVWSGIRLGPPMMAQIMGNKLRVYLNSGKMLNTVENLNVGHSLRVQQYELYTNTQILLIVHVCYPLGWFLTKSPALIITRYVFLNVND